jgi:hypothetical protein
MFVKRSLLHDEVIQNKIIEMQVKYLDTLYSSNSLSTDWLIDNNQIAYSDAKTPEEQETLIKNVEGLKKNQEDRIRSAEYFKSQIEFLQSILALSDDEEFEINTELKELIV